MTYFLLSLGCQMNLSDSERVHTLFSSMGFKRVEDENQAQILGIMACSVRQSAIDRVYSRIHKWNKRKQKENVITFVSGCVLPSDGEKFLKLFDFVFPTAQMETLPEQLAQYGIASPVSTTAVIQVDSFWKVKPSYSSPYDAYIPIQNGCDKFCTFCAVPYTRGREVSRESGEILKEFQNLLKKGYKRITLLGQNVNSYGFDRTQEISFNQLLDQIGEMGDGHKDKIWVYFTSPHPRDMNEELFEIIAKHPSLANQIHLPLQSGDDHILIKMNRNHSMERYEQLVSSIRKTIPHAAISTDIIVGFPGEQENHFENTKQAMRQYQFNMAFIAKYSPRPGAASAKWEDEIPMEVKKERHQILSGELEKSSLSFNRKYLGQMVDVLVENFHNGYLWGKTEGRVNIKLNHQNELFIGQFVRVKITRANTFTLEGDILPEVVLV